MKENNIMLVRSGEPRTELQQAYDRIAVLEAKIENLELKNKELRILLGSEIEKIENTCKKARKIICD